MCVCVLLECSISINCGYIPMICKSFYAPHRYIIHVPMFTFVSVSAKKKENTAQNLTGKNHFTIPVGF